MRKLPKKGIITVAFDDAYLDTYRYAVKHLTRRNIKSTIALPAGLMGKTFENRRVIGLKELKKAVKAGHEIASHTLTHPNLLKINAKDKKAALSEMACSKRELERLLPCRVSSFVFPYIKKSQSRALRLKVKSYYKSARITHDRPFFNKIPLKDAYSLKGLAIMKNHSLRFLNKQVDYAEKNKCWLIEVFHLVGRKNTLSAHRPKPYRYFMHINDFKKHIDYIISKDVLILTQEEAHELQNPRRHVISQ